MATWRPSQRRGRTEVLEFLLEVLFGVFFRFDNRGCDNVGVYVDVIM